jgi:hypothetical protein
VRACTRHLTCPLLPNANDNDRTPTPAVITQTPNGPKDSPAATSHQPHTHPLDTKRRRLIWAATAYGHGPSVHNGQWAMGTASACMLVLGVWLLGFLFPPYLFY